MHRMIIVVMIVTPSVWSISQISQRARCQYTHSIQGCTEQANGRNYPL